MSRYKYSEDFRNNALQQLLRPNSDGIKITAEKIGIPWETLYSWKRKYVKNGSMEKSKKMRIEDWSPERKLEVIFDTRAMTENELGEYLRKNGLHSEDLTALKRDALSGFRSKGRPKLDPEVVELRKERKILERNLRRTEKALAEQSARIILLKKSHEIWGVPEDEE